jgi:hypothetical protein
MREGLFASLLVLLPSTALGGEVYTMEDLTALADNESWSEILEHVEDIKPRERKQQWRELLEKAAIGHLDALAGQKKKYEGLGSAEQILTRFPILKKSKPYMDKRADVGLLAFEECFSNRWSGPQCVEQLREFVKADPGNDELAFKAGKVVTDVGKMWQAGPVFFVDAVADSKARGERCKDGDLSYSTLASFGAPPDYDSTKAAMKIAFEHCYDGLQPKLLEKLYEATGYEARNLCAGLTKRKAKLTTFQQAHCKDTLKEQK